MVSCSGRMFATGSGAQWLLKTCAARRPAFQSQQCSVCSCKDRDTHCTTWCKSYGTAYSRGPEQGISVNNRTGQHRGYHLAVLGGGERLAAVGVQDSALLQGLADLAGVAGARSHVPCAHGRAAQPAGLVIVDVPATISTTHSYKMLTCRAILHATSATGPLHQHIREDLSRVTFWKVFPVLHGLDQKDMKVKMSACSYCHLCACPTPVPGRIKSSPSGPGFAQALGILRVDSQNRPCPEATLQQVHRMEPDALEGLPVHRVAWLLRVHFCLRAAADM